jgi:hypothetical protein
MTISSLVITLTGDARERGSALGRLQIDPRLTLGSIIADRLPAVAETVSALAGEGLVEDLLAMPGVSFVDVVAVHFDGRD